MYLHQDILTRFRLFNRFLPSPQTGDLIFISGGHDHNLHSFANGSTLHFAHGNRSSIRVSIEHRKAHRSARIAIRKLKGIQQANERVRARVVFRLCIRWLPPLALRRAHLIQYVSSRQTGNGNEFDLLLDLVPTTLQKRFEFSNALIISLLLPLHSGIVHLVDHHDEMGNAKRLRQHSMLARLSSTIKSSFKLTLSCTNHQNTHISLRCTHNHIRNVVFVTGCV
mmetsp:Transcript_1512/g.2413  ORF Transcript_1512/g.2413 Transcript_1512/m.2413 type:complete len:224 (+) Transcript_1512:762-1433(+)